MKYLFLVLAFVCSEASAFDFGGALKQVEKVISGQQSIEVPAKGRMEVAFSPNEGGEELIIKVINSASKTANGEILMLTYSFTSAPITDALLKAIKRGVTVRLVADYKNNLSEGGSNKARAALSALKNAGADIRVIKVYQIHHDKVIIVNRQTVELGSYNYSAAADTRNSENVLVNWDNPDLAAVYVKHFERNYKKSEELPIQY